jgi:CPA2 family monovalent cation:H+ antiporter-2
MRPLARCRCGRDEESDVDHGPWLKDFLVFLVAAGLVVPLFHRARIGAVLGFLLVGVVVGPHGFGQLAGEYPWIRYLTIEDRERAVPFAELGVMFLLFLIGLELSFERLWSLRRQVFGIGGLQFVLTAIMIAAALSVAVPKVAVAIVLGLAFAMSSTAIVMQLLEEQGRSATPLGRVALSVLLFQDLMVAPVLFGTEVLAHGKDHIALGLAWALLQAVAVVVAIAALGYFVLRPVFRFAAQTGSRELIMAITLLMVVGISVATGLAGLSTALGAFLTGLLLSETEYRYQIEIDFAPFKGLLLGLFFVTVGMTLDLRALWENALFIVGIVVALLAAKAAVIFAASRLFGVTRAVAIEAAVLLPQAGEFGFVVIALATAAALLPPATAQIAAAVVAITMLLTPMLALAARWLGHRLQFLDHGQHMPARSAAELEDHVVIGGFGRVGQMVGRLLAAENIPYVALDPNGELVAEQRAAGEPVYFGDAGRREMLMRLGAERARAFVVTVNAPRAAERMVLAAHRIRPDAPVFARAADSAHAARLLKLGAVGVIPETVDASLQLAGRLLESIGVPDDAVLRRIDEMREQELGRLAQGGKA